MTDHQVLPPEPAARRRPSTSDVSALRLLLSGADFEPQPLGGPQLLGGFGGLGGLGGLDGAQDELEGAEEECAGSAPHCRHAMYYVD